MLVFGVFFSKSSACYSFFFHTNALITPKIYIVLSKYKSVMVEYQVESLRMHFIFTFFNVVHLKYNSTRVEY
jgi:hypothetical protein